MSRVGVSTLGASKAAVSTWAVFKAALKAVLAVALVAAGLPLQALPAAAAAAAQSAVAVAAQPDAAQSAATQPGAVSQTATAAQRVAATQWTPGDAWDSGSTNAAVGGRPFSGQMHLLPSSHQQPYQRFYAFVDAGGSLEARMLAYAFYSGSAAGVATIRVTSPAGQVFYAEQAFDGISGFVIGVDPVREVVIGVDEPLTSDSAGVWTVDMFNALDTPSVDASALRWDIVPRDADGTAHQGRVWTYNYRRAAHRIHLNAYTGDAVTRFDAFPAGNAPHGTVVWNQSAWIWSPEGLLLRVDDMGYNGLISSLWATSHGLVDADCQPLRVSRSMGGGWPGTALADAQRCGLPLYRVFFEHPDLTMPASAQFFDDATGQIVADHRVTFDFVQPELGSISFTQTGSGNVFDGQIAVELSGQPTTVRVELDLDGDGNFDGPADRLLIDSWTLQPGTTSLPWDGMDAYGLPVSLEQSVGIRVTLLSSFETHIVANDVEWRLGGIRLTALNGPLAASADTRYLVNWDDSDPSFFDGSGNRLCWGNDEVPLACREADVFPESVVGTQVDSRDGVHRWGGIPTATDAHGSASWGDGRDMVTWQTVNFADFADAEVSGVVRLGGEADLEISIDFPVDAHTSEPIVPVCSPSTDIVLEVTVTNHGPDQATGVTVALPAGTALITGADLADGTALPAGTALPDGQGQVSANAAGDRVLVGEVPVGGQVSFLVLSSLFEACTWDVTVSVEGQELDLDLSNNTARASGEVDHYLGSGGGLGGGQDVSDAGDGSGLGSGGPAGGGLPGGQDLPAGQDTSGGAGGGGVGGEGADSPAAAATAVRAPARLPLTGAGVMWLVCAGAAVAAGLVLAFVNRRSTRAASSQ